MGHEVTIGGERLGGGKKMKAYLHNYERSTHDKSFAWRSTMSAGTLVPFLVELALPGDTYDINLNLSVLTHPTSGPLFGHYKVYCDVFQAPIRLYQGLLHMNMLGIGMDMSKVPLPQILLEGGPINKSQPIDNQQINPSSIFSYLGIRGIGYNPTDQNTYTIRKFNAIPYLAYWEIYKNYYANKQEEIGAVIHTASNPPTIQITNAALNLSVPAIPVMDTTPVAPFTYIHAQLTTDTLLFTTATGVNTQADPQRIRLYVRYVDTQLPAVIPATQLFSQWNIDPSNGTMFGTVLTQFAINNLDNIDFGGIDYSNNPNPVVSEDQEPKIQTFPLENIDTMRKNILAHTDGTEFVIGNGSPQPYNLPLEANIVQNVYSKKFSQEGLALRTYASDLFNNWIQTEWIDGPDGVSAITAIDTSGGSFTIDELNLSRKIYDMLNRIAISGGSYDDWLDAVYTHERHRGAENPMYIGGLIQKLVFQEVISNTGTDTEPLGSLAGRGVLSEERKGGNIVAKVDEPSYLIGIVSIVPVIDYSQGNEWDTNLRTMNDLHKPALDQIGYQDLITDQMAWWETAVDATTRIPTFRSAGKQPAWINYMTNINKVKGNFASQNSQMYMVLNRRYEPDYAGGTPKIADLTTYIDPTKFNHIFADARLDAQNFWTQIGVGMEVRRKMSAKVMPNL